MKNLILSGGIFHPFAETSASVARCLETEGITSRIVGVAEGFRLLGEESFDLVTVNALAWSMMQADKYLPFRAEYAFDPSPQARASFLHHLERGGGLLGLHTAAICFDTWPEWRDILPAAWIWGRSHHPAPGYFSTTDETYEFRIWDELYCDMEIAGDATVLATATAPNLDREQPVMVAREQSVYLALGHDVTATENPGFQRLLVQGTRLALGGRGK
jgi:uncharacterized protein